MPGRTHCIACGTPLVGNETSIDVAAVPQVESRVATPVSPVMPLPEPQLSASEPVAVLPDIPMSPELGTASAPAMDMLPDLPSLGSQVTALPSVEAGYVGAPVVPVVEPALSSADSWLDANPSAPVVTLPEIPVPVQPQTGVGDRPRVNVQFDDNEVAEMPMPVQAVNNVAGLTDPINAPNVNATGEEGEPHTGPWLALTVLGVGIVFFLWLIWFLYHLLFGTNTGGTSVNTMVPTVISTPTAIVTSTPVAALSINDMQREKDIADLRIALVAYYQGKQRYPTAGNYNSLLNALIGGGYLNRRIQDPAFPAQEYKYSVDSSGNSYDIAITFDTTASTLLGGQSSPVYHMRPAQ